MLMSSKIEKQKTMLISVFEFFSDLWISDRKSAILSDIIMISEAIKGVWQILPLPILPPVLTDDLYPA